MHFEHSQLVQYFTYQYLSNAWIGKNVQKSAAQLLPTT